MNTTTFNPRELCSRKLWQMVNAPANEPTSENELHEAIAELAARRHYLAELREIGKIEEYKPEA